MATYTITKVFVRPSTGVDWPWTGGILVNMFVDINADEDIVTLADKVSDDGLTSTVVETWKTKQHYTDIILDRGDAVWATIADASNTYMAINGISCTITEEDGRVKIFNDVNKTFELQE
jgi:hypothetical protein|tara:strand:+ start:30 stop:386 length:357 start_codon:yes stop_codon:yes gene_type:complete